MITLQYERDKRHGENHILESWGRSLTSSPATHLRASELTAIEEAVKNEPAKLFEMLDKVSKILKLAVMSLPMEIDILLEKLDQNAEESAAGGERPSGSAELRRDKRNDRSVDAG